jgi:hypothetical protein
VAAALAAAGQIEQAQQVAEGIAGDRQRAEALRAVAAALAAAGQFAQARQVAAGIADNYWRAEALSAVAGALAQLANKEALLVPMHGLKGQAGEMWLAQLADNEALLALVQRAWHGASTRDSILELANTAAGLIARQPTLGIAMVDGITWVDDFLKQA